VGHKLFLLIWDVSVVSLCLWEASLLRLHHDNLSVHRHCQIIIDPPKGEGLVSAVEEEPERQPLTNPCDRPEKRFPLYSSFSINEQRTTTIHYGP
jgi:hypothetical protein